MFSTELLKNITRPQKIVTSRPIFQFSSTFIHDDDDDLKKPSPLPLFNKHIPNTSTDVAQPGPAPRFQLVLHVLNIILSFASAALFTSAIPIWNANFEHTRSIVAGDYTDGLVLIPLLFSILASAYIVVTEHAPARFRLQPRFARSSSLAKESDSTRLRPSRRVLLCLTIILILAPALTLSATNSLALLWKAPVRSKNGLIICNLSNIFAQPCQPILYQVGGIQIGGIVAGGLAWFVWAVILIAAIRGWVRDRKEKQEAANARRRRRHERRRRHDHEHGFRPERRHRHRNGHDGDIKRSHHRPERSNYEGSQSGKLPPRSGSPAAQMASHNLRPKQTIQVWLNDRYV